jgi:hypothetical protein
MQKRQKVGSIKTSGELTVASRLPAAHMREGSKGHHTV